MAKNNNFHKTVRYRRFKTMLYKFESMHEVNISTYDLDNIVCYKTNLSTFAGITTNVSPGFTAFDRNNYAEVYEIPSKYQVNPCKLIGDFLLVYGDSKAAEYTIVKMSTWYDYAVCELKAQYYFVGTYLVFTNFKNIDIRKRNLAGRFDYAFNWKFDKFGIRNRAYAKKYGVMKTTRLLNQSKDYVRIASRKPVKIYKNKSKKK